MRKSRFVDKEDLKYFEFKQNNSGGTFHLNGDVGHTVLIQAANADEANRIAQEVGIYFNECDDDRDCSCCGDRWYPAFEHRPEKEVTVPVYLPDGHTKMTLKEWIEEPTAGYFGIDKTWKMVVHHYDGRVQIVEIQNDPPELLRNEIV